MMHISELNFSQDEHIQHNYKTGWNISKTVATNIFEEIKSILILIDHKKHVSHDTKENGDDNNVWAHYIFGLLL